MQVPKKSAGVKRVRIGTMAATLPDNHATVCRTAHIIINVHS